MFSKIRKKSLLICSVLVLSFLSAAPAAHAETNSTLPDVEVGPPISGGGSGPVMQPRVCTGPSPVYSFSNVTTSTRPTNVKSAYITGPGTVSYNKTVSATVSATLSGSVSAEAGVVLAKASTSIGVAVTGSRTWTDGFSYTLTVPSGQRRAMQLFQSSRAFNVKKEVLVSPCSYKVVYSGANVNAPRTARQDEWKLVP